MTVADLIELLTKFDPTKRVILQKDAEGNGYSPLASAEEVQYEEHTTWSGEILHPEDAAQYEEGVLEPVVVLWPVN